MTKTSKALALFEKGCIRESLMIFRNFKIGFSKNERRTLQIACECMSGNAAFYNSLGIDTRRVINEAKCIIKKKYDFQ